MNSFHFNQPSHNSSHMTISVLEKVHQIDRDHREDRERNTTVQTDERRSFPIDDAFLEDLLE